MLEIKVSRLDGISTFAMHGRFDGLGAQLFEQEASGELDWGNHWILDFNGVNYLSSVGIRSLIKYGKKLKSANKMIILSALSKEVRTVLDTTGVLGLFKEAASSEEAQVSLSTEKDIASTVKEFSAYGRDCTLQIYPHQNCVVEVWNPGSALDAHNNHSGDLIMVANEDIQLAFGLGGLAHDEESAREAMGIFAAIDQLIGVLPADGFNHADFMINNSGEAVMYLASAIGFSGMPTARLDITGGLPVQLKDIQPLAARQLQENGVETTPVWGMLIAADLEPGKGSYFHNQQDIAKGRTLYRDFTGQPGMVCIALAGQTSWNGDANLAPFMAQWGVRAGSDFFKGHAFILSQPLDWVRIEQTKEIWKQCSDLDSLEDVLMVDGDVAITSARIWIWMPELIRTGQEKQLAIELTEEVPFPKEWEVITRRLFSDARRVILDPLVGGFSEGKPFRVTAYDKDNRRMLPTVLKLGPSSLISREIDNHKKYVQNYILNNSTTIMAQSSFGQASGMLYNFLGINGPDSKLGWLTNRYREENIEVLKALFSRIFTSILKPWYGQPVWESMRLYQQHNPLRLFPGLLAAAEQETGVSCDIRTIECPELGTTLPNPYYFLKHEYPKRQNQAQLWYSSINHGDLNMQNILLDERDNVYIIDFAETRSRNIVSDFARLEPIFKFEMTRLADEEDLIRFIEFEQALARTDSLEQVPEWAYKGTDPTVRKAYEMICLIRKYAKTVVIFENDIIPYLLAMLEWTYPIVIYRQITPQGKKAAVYSAALIVEQIMRLEK